VISLLSKFRDYYYALYPGKHHEYYCKLNEIEFLYTTNRKDDLFRIAKRNRLLSFEPTSLLMWQKGCSTGGIAIDIGAYTGIYTVTAILSGADQIYTFEPNLVISNFLEKNIKMNVDGAKVVLRKIALGSEIGEGELLAPKNRLYRFGNSTGSGIQLATATNNRDLGAWQKFAEIKISTLDLEVPEIDHPSVKMIKIDVEGFEMEVLRGAKKILSSSNPTVIVEALTQDNKREILIFMSMLKYSLICEAEKNLIFKKS